MCNQIGIWGFLSSWCAMISIFICCRKCTIYVQVWHFHSINIWIVHLVLSFSAGCVSVRCSKAVVQEACFNILVYGVCKSYKTFMKEQCGYSIETIFWRVGCKVCLNKSDDLSWTWSCSIVSRHCGMDPVLLALVGWSPVWTRDVRVGPLHDRVYTFPVHCLLLK